MKIIIEHKDSNGAETKITLDEGKTKYEGTIQYQNETIAKTIRVMCEQILKLSRKK